MADAAKRREVSLRVTRRCAHCFRASPHVDHISCCSHCPSFARNPQDLKRKAKQMTKLALRFTQQRDQGAQGGDDSRAEGGSGHGSGTTGTTTSTTTSGSSGGIIAARGASLGHRRRGGGGRRVVATAAPRGPASTMTWRRLRRPKLRTRGGRGAKSARRLLRLHPRPGPRPRPRSRTAEASASCRRREWRAGLGPCSRRRLRLPRHPHRRTTNVRRRLCHRSSAGQRSSSSSSNNNNPLRRCSPGRWRRRQ